MASSSRLKPGEKGKIRVAVDIRGKFGNIMKTVQVQTNDPQRPQTTLSMKMKIKDLIHIKKFKAAEIFSSACRGCHVNSGRGRKGFDLFINDCMMCHNMAKSASPLAAMRTKTREEVEKAIREGVQKTSMPGWDAKHDGPLTEEEIRGLVDYIRPVSRRSKN